MAIGCSIFPAQLMNGTDGKAAILDVTVSINTPILIDISILVHFDLFDGKFDDFSRVLRDFSHGIFQLGGTDARLVLVVDRVDEEGQRGHESHGDGNHWEQREIKNWKSI